MWVKVIVVVTAAEITFDFSTSIVGNARVVTMETLAQCFLKGHSQSPGPHTIPTPCANKVVEFEDLFSARLCMPLHLVLVKILQKFHIQLHHLTLNAIV
jgi:hypothetical protein